MLILLTERASGFFPKAMSYHANVVFPVGHEVASLWWGTSLHGGMEAWLQAGAVVIWPDGNGTKEL